MVDIDVVGDRHGLGEVYHPDGGSPLVVDEEEGAADQLVSPEEMRLFDGRTDALQSF